MTTIDIRIDHEKPEISLNDSDLFLDGTPLIVLHYPGFQLYLTSAAVFQLKQSLKIGEGMIQNYRQFLEASNNLSFTFADY